jgi:hypothetical protein
MGGGGEMNILPRRWGIVPPAAPGVEGRRARLVVIRVAVAPPPPAAAAPSAASPVALCEPTVRPVQLRLA